VQRCPTFEQGEGALKGDETSGFEKALLSAVALRQLCHRKGVPSRKAKPLKGDMGGIDVRQTQWLGEDGQSHGVHFLPPEKARTFDFTVTK